MCKYRNIFKMPNINLRARTHTHTQVQCWLTSDVYIYSHFRLFFTIVLYFGVFRVLASIEMK